MSIEITDPRIKAYLEDLAGEEGIEVAKLLKKEGEVVDNDLAEALEWKPSAVRKVLYKLYEGRAAEYLRDRDPETGYEIFIWSLDLAEAMRAIQIRQQEQLEDLREARAYEEENRFHVCETCNRRFLFEEASESDFHCPDDGGTLEYEDNADVVAQLTERIEEMEADLEEIREIVAEAEAEAQVERKERRKARLEREEAEAEMEAAREAAAEAAEEEEDEGDDEEEDDGGDEDEDGDD